MIENVLATALCLIACVGMGKYWRWLNSPFLQKLSKIPGPKGLPLIGIIASIPSENMVLMSMGLIL